MPKADEELFVNFYYFWKWEYTRRNERYKNKINRVMSGELDMEDIWGNDIFMRSREEYQVSIGDFALFFPNKFESNQIEDSDTDKEIMSFIITIPNQFPTTEVTIVNRNNNSSDFLYQSSNDIITSILNNNFKYKIPDLMLDGKSLNSTRYIDKEVYTIIPHKVLDDYNEGVCNFPFTGRIASQSFYEYMISIAKNERLPIEMNQSEELFVINLDSDIEKTVNEIYFFLKLRRGERDYKMARDHILEKGTTKRKSRDLPRAIGLWLWDYIDQHKIAWTHRAKSYKAFDSIFHNPNKQDMYIDSYFTTQKLASLLDITSSCIQSMDVLPMG